MKFTVPKYCNYSQPILAILFMHFGCIASNTLNYFAFQSFNF